MAEVPTYVPLVFGLVVLAGLVVYIWRRYLRLDPVEYGKYVDTFYARLYQRDAMQIPRR